MLIKLFVGTQFIQFKHIRYLFIEFIVIRYDHLNSLILELFERFNELLM